MEELIQAAREHHIYFLALVVLIGASYTFLILQLKTKDNKLDERDKEIEELNKSRIEDQNERRRELLTLYRESNKNYSDVAAALRSMQALIEGFMKKPH